MSLKEDIQAALQEDETLAGLLTGGIYTGVEEINRASTPGAFDSTTKELKPCALIKLGTELKTGPYARSVNSPVIIYFYQRDGYDAIDPAMERAYDLLNDERIGDGVWQVMYDISVPQQRDTALDCSLGMQRFVAVRHR